MNIFYPNTYTNLELECIKSDIHTEKLNILYEAVDNILNSNYMEAELKVYTENGTYNDLSMLYIEAKEEADNQKTGIIGTLINTIKNLCKKIKNFFINIFGKKKDSIPDQVKISKEDNNKIDTFNEVCDTVKPLLNGNVAEDELKEKSAFCTKKLALIGGGAIAATGISAVVVVNKNTIIEKLNKLFNNTNEIDSGLEKMKKTSNNDNKKGLLTVIQTVISGIGKFASGLINKITGESKSNTNESQSEQKDQNKSNKKEETHLTNQNQTDTKEKESKKEDIPENKGVKLKTDDKKDDEFEFKDEREKLLKKQRNGNISISESERLKELNNKYETFYKKKLNAKRVAREKLNNDDDELDLNDLPESKPDPEADKNHRKRLVELKLKSNFKTIDADKNYIESIIKNLENIKGTLPDMYYNKVYTKLQDILKNGDFNEPDDIMNSVHETIKKYVYNSSTKVSSEEWKQLEKFIKDCGYTEVDVKPGDDITPFRTYFERPISANNEGTPNTIKEIQLKPFVVKCEDSLFKLCGKCTYYK